MTRSAGRAALWLPPILYMLAIFYVSSQSNPAPAVTAIVWDKLLHTTEYAGLALLLCRALRGEGLRWTAALAAAVVLASAYGSTDELHQRFVPQRNSDVRDWAADTAGASLGAFGYAALAAGLASRAADNRRGL
jgi:VanZ family protein